MAKSSVILAILVLAGCLGPTNSPELAFLEGCWTSPTAGAITVVEFRRTATELKGALRERRDGKFTDLVQLDIASDAKSLRFLAGPDWHAGPRPRAVTLTRQNNSEGQPKEKRAALHFSDNRNSLSISGYVMSEPPGAPLGDHMAIIGSGEDDVMGELYDNDIVFFSDRVSCT